MDWFLLTLLSVLIVSVANIVQKVLLRDVKSNPYSYAVIFHLLLGILCLIIAFLNGFELPDFNVSLGFFLMAAGLWGTGTVLLFKALQLLESSEVTILISVRAIVTIVASILFLQETFNTQKAVGTVIILASTLLVSNQKKGFTLSKGLLYSLGTAFFYGLAVVFDVFNLRNYDPISYLAVINVMIGSSLLLFKPKSISHWREFARFDFLKKMVPLVLLSSIQAIAYYYALTKGPASQIAPINQGQVIITILLAVILLKERSHLLRKLMAAILVTIGVILLR